MGVVERKRPQDRYKTLAFNFYAIEVNKMDRATHLVFVLVVSSAIASPAAERPAVASETRSLDSIGGGNILRNLDSIGGGHVLRQLDSIGGGHILRNVPEYIVPRHPYYEKRGYDPLRGMTFGVQKKNFDTIDRMGFNNFAKKNFDSLDNMGFNNFVKKNFDSIDNMGFNDFNQRY